MTNSGLSKNISNYSPIHILVMFSGLAALSWEVIWQVKSTLALGVSAWGTAITLAATMGGMSLGAIVTGNFLKEKQGVRPVRMFGFLEIMVGVAGLFLMPAFNLVNIFDVWVYSHVPEIAHIAHLLGIVFSLGIPTFCLGATLPVFGLAARQHKTSIAVLYGLNTIGASIGALMAALLLIPSFGISGSIIIISSINIAVGIIAIFLDRKDAETQEKSLLEKARAKIHIKSKAKTKKEKQQNHEFSSHDEFLIVCVTGFAVFMLEVAWFRSFAAAFLSTTAAFAIMLSCVLIALGVGARAVPFLKRQNKPLSSMLAWAGILILLVTPIIERFDYIASVGNSSPYLLYTSWIVLTLYTVGAPVLLLGVALPWILDEQKSTRKWGFLYGSNAISAITGAIAAGWIFLPLIGFAKTSWFVGIIVICTGIYIAEKEKRKRFAMIGLCALLVASIFEMDIGKARVQLTTYVTSPQKRVIKSFDGPDVSVAAIEHENGERTLVIDGFVATGQETKTEGTMWSAFYMEWMGHLPMILHPDPKKALVIAFGTGQTSNSVRKENPERLDIVEINKRVLQLAPAFSANEDVLHDPRVNPVVMDGRAYLRRTGNIYDVITLEPMPPTFAGVNALYSQEFYQQARKHLSPDGVIAQWLPFHLVAPYYSASVARTFQSVFPSSILWVDHVSNTGILLGTLRDDPDFGRDMPGYRGKRGQEIKRTLSEVQAKESILFYPDELKKYGEFGEVITDDNQLLAFGRAVNMTYLKLEPDLFFKGHIKIMSQVKGAEELQNFLDRLEARMKDKQ
jgi:spermidine synthase